MTPIKMPCDVHYGDDLLIKDQIVSQASTHAQAITMSGGRVTVVDSSVTDGNLFWGHGGNTVTMTNVHNTGTPWKYVICNFDHPIQSVVIDNSGIVSPGFGIRQGMYEAASRWMQTEYFHSIGVQYVGRKDVHGYIKQTIQHRSGGEHIVEGGEITGGIDIGWMTDPSIPIQTLDHFVLKHVKIDTMPSFRDGCKFAEIIDCNLNGKMINLTHRWK